MKNPRGLASVILIAVYLLALCAAAGPATQPHALVVTEGGTYIAVPGEQLTLASIRTTAPVVLDGYTFPGTGNDMISGGGAANLTIRNCRFGKNPPHYAVHIWAVNKLIFEHNAVEQNGGCVTSINGSGTISNRFNSYVNISGATGPTTKVKVSAFQIDLSHSPNIEFAWNAHTNVRGICAVEDQESLMQSGGTPGHPALIHDILVDGGFQYPLNNTANSSQSGIMAYDPGTSFGQTGGGYTHVWNCTVLNNENKGISCAGSHDIEIDHNILVGTDMRQTDAGCQIWNWANKTPANKFGPFHFHDNKAWWILKGVHKEFVLAIPPTVATNNQVVEMTADAARAAWWQRVKDQGIVIGPYPNPTRQAVGVFEATKFDAAGAKVQIVPLPSENLGPPTACGYTSGQFVRYDNIDFGMIPTAFTMSASIGAQATGGTIEVHFDAVDGPLVATFPIVSTNGWYSYHSILATTSKLSGYHDVVFVWPTSAANLHSFSFSRDKEPSSRSRMPLTSGGRGRGRFNL